MLHTKEKLNRVTHSTTFKAIHNLRKYHWENFYIIWSKWYCSWIPWCTFPAIIGNIDIRTLLLNNTDCNLGRRDGKIPNTIPKDLRFWPNTYDQWLVIFWFEKAILTKSFHFILSVWEKRNINDLCNCFVQNVGTNEQTYFEQNYLKLQDQNYKSIFFIIKLAIAGLPHTKGNEFIQ